MKFPRKFKLFLFTLLPIIGGGIFLRWYNQPYFTSVIADYIYKKYTNTSLRYADTYKYQRDYHKADSVFQTLLKDNSLSEEERIYTYNQLAYVHLKMYNDSVALHYLNKLESEYPNFKINNSNAIASFCFNKGLYCYQNFHPKEAEYWLKRTLELYKNLYPNDHWRIGECLNTLGMYYYEFGQKMDSAIKYIPLANNIYKNSPYLKGLSQENELGMAHYSWLQRNSEAGQTHCELAITLAEKAPFVDSVFIGRCYSMKGNFVKKRGQIETDTLKQVNYFKEAEALYKKAIEVSKNSQLVRVQEFYRDIIINYYWLKDSTSFFQKLKELEAILKKQPDRYGQPDRLKGYYYAMSNDVKNGIHFYEKFYNYYINDSLKNSLLLSETFYLLSSSYQTAKNYEKAIYYTLKGAKQFTDIDTLTLENIHLSVMYNKIPNQFVFFEKISKILLLKYKEQNDFQSLLKSYDLVCLADELLFPNIYSVDESAIATFQKEVAENIYSQALEICYELYDKTRKPKYLDDAFRFCEKTKSFLLLRELSNNHTLSNLNTPSKLVQDSIRRISAEINKLRYIRDNANITIEQSQQLIRLQDKQRDIYNNLKEKYPEYYRQKVNQPVHTLQEVRTLLKPNQLLLNYSIRNEELYLLTVSKDTIIFNHQKEVKLLNKYIANLNALIVSRDTHKAALHKYVLTTGWLYDYLLGSIPPQLIKGKELIIAPDKSLNQIPFEALVKQEKGLKNFENFKNLSYILYSNQIIYTPAWRLYFENKDISIPENPRILAITYGDVVSEKALLYSEREIRYIGKIFKNVKIGINKECSKEYFLKKHQLYDILHLSLHAESSITDKRDNKLYFKLPFKDTLYGFDIEKQSFKAQLAVLSACQTASGKTNTGEGVYSLSRSFLQAGVKHIIASLWKVDDWATSELMKNFYSELSSNSNPTYAIHNAKIQYLNNIQDAQYAHPYFWSSFLSIH